MPNVGLVKVYRKSVAACAVGAYDPISRGFPLFLTHDAIVVDDRVAVIDIGWGTVPTAGVRTRFTAPFRGLMNPLTFPVPAGTRVGTLEVAVSNLLITSSVILLFIVFSLFCVLSLT